MVGSAWRVESVHPTHTDAAELIDELSDDLAARYRVVWPGSTGRTNYVPADFDPATDAFLVGYLDDEPAACGALRRFADDTVEIKRMYVKPPHRGNGWGAQMLTALEAEARRMGYNGIVLETGTEQPEALGLYANHGYSPTEPWPPYDTRAYARCFRKPL